MDSKEKPKRPVDSSRKKRTPPRSPKRSTPHPPPPENAAPRQSAEKKAQKRRRPAAADAVPPGNGTPAGALPVQDPKPVKRKASRAKKQQIAAVLLLLLTLYLLINLAVFGILLLDFNRQPDEAKPYTLVLRRDKTKVATIDAAQANNEYGLYVPYSKLSMIADLSIMGDNENIIILVRPGNDRIEINNNSSLIYINDNAIRLSKPVIFQLNDYLLPIELISNYIDGITIAFDDKNSTCTLTRSTQSDVLVAAKIVAPNGIGKCSIPPEPAPSQPSMDTSSDASSDVGGAESDTSGAVSAPGP